MSLRASHVHDCAVGFTLGAGVDDATIEGNVFERFVQDGVNITGSTDVVFRANTVRNMHDPSGAAHNDAIQLTGNVERLLIDGNVLSDSHHHLIMMQDNRGPINDVLVQNNILTGGGGYAAQAEHVTNLRIVNNTVWGSWSGIAIRNRVGTPTTDTVVVNNVLQGLSFREGTSPSRVANNVMGACATPKAGFACSTMPMFVDEVAGDFRLLPNSIARGLADPRDAPVHDILRKRRAAAPSAGAFD